MTPLQQFRNLPRGDRSLLLYALALVIALRIALWILPFRWICRAVQTSPVHVNGSSGRFAWAVQAAARRVPQATCLTQALALHHLLACAGLPSFLRVGVAKDARGGIESHAWVEHEGVVLIGDNGKLESYSPMFMISAAS
jgi:hypothetical protein